MGTLLEAYRLTLQHALGSLEMRLVKREDSEKLLSTGLEYSSLNIRLASSDKDRDEIYKIRYKVFNEELGEGLPESALTERDVDKFDENCDHLLIEKENKIIGTYRLLPGPRISKEHGFYSETEFRIKNLPIDFNKSLEMGRACILPDHRKQATLICLFIGIRHCMNLRNCNNLFGLASLAPMSHENALATYQKIHSMGRVLEISGVEPLASMSIPVGTRIGSDPHIPSLMSVYFGMGAYVCARPAYDPVFRCHDMLTLLRLEEIPQRSWDFLTKFTKRKAGRNKEEP
jgi:putative hemolysin